MVSNHECGVRSRDFDYQLQLLFASKRYEVFVAPSNDRWVMILKDFGVTIKKTYANTREEAKDLAHANARLLLSYDADLWLIWTWL